VISTLSLITSLLIPLVDQETQSKLTIRLNGLQTELEMLRVGFSHCPSQSFFLHPPLARCEQEEVVGLRTDKKALSETAQRFESQFEKGNKEKEQIQSRLSASQDKITTLSSQLHATTLEVNKYKDMVSSWTPSPLLTSFLPLPQLNLKEEELKLLQLRNAEELRILSSRITEAVARELSR
jgi:uncharacterized phage infection (PIP) family protein YhgE